jgi:hypothetical protein
MIRISNGFQGFQRQVCIIIKRNTVIRNEKVKLMVAAAFLSLPAMLWLYLDFAFQLFHSSAGY